jgi:transposase
LQQLRKEYDEVKNELSDLKQEIYRLKELLQIQQNRRFGKSKETSKPQDDNADVDESVITVPSYTRRKVKKNGRLLDTSDLPRYRVIHDLPEDKKICACCNNALRLLKEEITEQVEIIPAKFSVIEHVQMKYSCRHCETIHLAPKPLPPIPKSIAGPSLLADIAVSKYSHHLPLYRQSKIMMQQGINIPDNTLANWMTETGNGLRCVYEALWIILQERYLQVDETPVKVLEPEKKGYLWTYYAPHIGNEKGLVVFEFNLTRSGKVVDKRLADFTGLLQTDGYAGYNALHAKKNIADLGCLTHVRRKYMTVVKVTGDNSGIAAQMIERMKPLYALEARMRADARITFRTRKNLRRRVALPILKEIYLWVCTVRPQVPPKSKLGKAIQHTFNQWKRVINYVNHGEAEIDTNGVENKIREVALGKKNWLFIGNKDSGEIHSIFYSLIISSILNDINPRVYIHYLISKIHDLRRGTIKPVDLLPDRIDIENLGQFANEQIAFAKAILNTS